MSSAATALDVRLERPGFTLEIQTAWAERVAVLFGPSGSGKTTLLEVILGLHRPARCRVTVASESLEDTVAGNRLAIEARCLGWVPQEPSLLPHLSVAGNLRLGSRRAGSDGARHLARAVDVLEIGSLLERSVSQLSGGEAQRVALARALASGPRALLMDEPFASVDVDLRARLLPFLLRVRDELELPMIHITHDPDEAMLLADVLVVLDGGRVVASGAPAEVLWSRAVLPLSEALGVENVLEACGTSGSEAETVVETPGGLRLVVPGRVAPGERVRLGLRAEDLLLATGAPGRLSARNIFPAQVEALEERDGDVLVRLRAPEPLVAKLTHAATVSLELQRGSQVHVVIKAQAIRRLV